MLILKVNKVCKLTKYKTNTALSISDFIFVSWLRIFFGTTVFTRPKISDIKASHLVYTSYLL